jgi:hypothetical protein
MKAKPGPFIPPNFARLMSPTDRKAVGILSTEEVRQHADARHEDELQRDIVRLLDQRGLFFSRARMDKKTTVRVGMFDFTIYLPTGKFLAVEVKVKDGKLSMFQQKLFTEFWEKTGQVVHIIMSLEQMRILLNEHMPV